MRARYHYVCQKSDYCRRMSLNEPSTRRGQPSGHSMMVRYSNVQGGFAGEGNVDVAPQFAASSKGDFHRMPGSLCIDAGDPATFTPEGMTDLDGDPRAFGSRIDMGIDEFRTTGDVTGDHAVNVDDLIAVIIAWGPCTWSTADLNHDFMVDVDDLVAVIMNWGRFPLVGARLPGAGPSNTTALFDGAAESRMRRCSVRRSNEKPPGQRPGRLCSSL
jgi:hypothetical protein